jgi:hypothetical protein
MKCQCLRRMAPIGGSFGWYVVTNGTRNKAHLDLYFRASDRSMLRAPSTASSVWFVSWPRDTQYLVSSTARCSLLESLEVRANATDPESLAISHIFHAVLWVATGRKQVLVCVCGLAVEVKRDYAISKCGCSIQEYIVFW